MFFLGIDGGGTKTAFLLINENGDIIEAKTIATVSYKHVGMDNSIALLKETVHEILNDREAYISFGCLFIIPNDKSSVFFNFHLYTVTKIDP